MDGQPDGKALEEALVVALADADNVADGCALADGAADGVGIASSAPW